MEGEAVRPGRYRHYKGGEYRVLGTARHSETLEEMVVYEALYENDLSKLWVRPLTEFLEEVEFEGEKCSRFRYIEENGDSRILFQ